jgi:Ca2+-binding RTX toxin-like protein
MPDETKKPPILGAPRDGGEPTGSGDKDPIFPTHRDDGTYDIIIGTSGNDELFGYGGNDTLVGGAGRDILHGGLGEDLMLGGTDDDTYYVNEAGDVVSEAEGEGIDLIVSSVTYNLSASVEISSLAVRRTSTATATSSTTPSSETAAATSSMAALAMTC